MLWIDMEHGITARRRSCFLVEKERLAWIMSLWDTRGFIKPSLPHLYFAQFLCRSFHHRSPRPVSIRISVEVSKGYAQDLSSLTFIDWDVDGIRCYLVDLFQKKCVWIMKNVLRLAPFDASIDPLLPVGGSLSPPSVGFEKSGTGSNTGTSGCSSILRPNWGTPEWETPQTSQGNQVPRQMFTCQKQFM